MQDKEVLLVHTLKSKVSHNNLSQQISTNLCPGIHDLDLDLYSNVIDHFLTTIRTSQVLEQSFKEFEFIALSQLIEEQYALVPH